MPVMADPPVEDLSGEIARLLGTTADDVVFALDARNYPYRPTKQTLIRWIHTGLKGRKLLAVRCGSRLYTSRTAIRGFLCPTVVSATATPQPDGLKESQSAREAIRQRHNI